LLRPQKDGKKKNIEIRGEIWENESINEKTNSFMPLLRVRI